MALYWPSDKISKDALHTDTHTRAHKNQVSVMITCELRNKFIKIKNELKVQSHSLTRVSVLIRCKNLFLESLLTD